MTALKRERKKERKSYPRSCDLMGTRILPNKCSLTAPTRARVLNSMAKSPCDTR